MKEIIVLFGIMLFIITSCQTIEPMTENDFDVIVENMVNNY